MLGFLDVQGTVYYLGVTFYESNGRLFRGRISALLAVDFQSAGTTDPGWGVARGSPGIAVLSAGAMAGR
jgi:hypothetical protein